MSRQTIAIDMGYGFTKGSTAGKGNFICPSLVSPARDIRYAGGLGSSNGITVAVGGKQYFVGDKAELQGRGSAQTLSNDRTGTDEMLALFYAACSDLVKVSTNRVTVVTGLPVADFDKANRKRLRAALKGDHIVERTGRTPRGFTVNKVVIVPQAVGTLYGMVLDRDGRVTQNQDLQQGRVAVIDVGQLTTNYVTLDALEYVDYLSLSKKTGVSRILDVLQRDLSDEYGLAFEKLSEVDRVVRDGFVHVMGEPIGIMDMIDTQVRVLGDLVLTQARSLWGSGADLTAVVLTGGGAELLAGIVKDAYPHTRLDPSGQFGNVQGYLRLALFVARQKEKAHGKS